MKKFVYLVIGAIIIVVLWIALGSQKKAVAPVVTAPVVTATPSVETNGSITVTTPPAPEKIVVQSGYFSQESASSLGTYLTDAKGMTLYTFGNDAPGVSNCYDTCIDKWPAYGPSVKAGTAPANLPMLPADVATTKRSDGTLQFTWKGMPLYYYFSDKNPGDTLGEGIGGVWYVVKL